MPDTSLLNDGELHRDLHGVSRVDAAESVPGTVAVRGVLTRRVVDAVTRLPQDVLHLVPAQRRIGRQDEGRDARDARAGARGATERVGVVAARVAESHIARVVAFRPAAVGGPDSRRPRRLPVVARESAPDGVAEIAVPALLA